MVDPKALGSIVNTGVPGLDDILGGGLHREHIYLIEGTPGSGKTTLAMQFLLDGAQRGERCVYITLSETERELRASAKSHGWSLEGVTLLEITPLEADPERQQGMIHPSEIELDHTVELILSRILELKPDRVVIDALTELRLLAQDALSYRRQVLTLKAFFARSQITVLALDDLTDTAQGLQLHSIVHGVVSLEQRRMEYGVVRRRLAVLKLRGVNFRSGYHDYVIRTGGVTVFPSLVAAEHESSFDTVPVSSEISEMDELLGAGLRRGTCALVLGPSGVGKSTLAIQYAIAGTRRGERAAIFAFDESYRTAARRSAALGMDIDAARRGGSLSWRQISPTSVSPGEFVEAVRRQVDSGARIIVIDSLNSYMGSMPEEQALLLHMHELLAYLGNRGVVTILIMAQHGLLGDAHAPIDLSFLADTIILLRYFEADGAVRKAVSVLKNRSGQHESTIRSYELVTNEGLKVGPPIREFRGVLRGAPIYVGPSAIIPPETHAGDASD
ncbi:ATPase domain-containing protein [Rhodoligotrophos ferricapiens]|uniref:ATPase domain-containing protein n=1 Tax=Rhodoligotrophos ferricapiens TaxID=3069264 RepID=UPI00315CCF75